MIIKKYVKGYMWLMIAFIGGIVAPYAYTSCCPNEGTSKVDTKYTGSYASTTIGASLETNLPSLTWGPVTVKPDLSGKFEGKVACLIAYDHELSHFECGVDEVNYKTAEDGKWYIDSYDGGGWDKSTLQCKTPTRFRSTERTNYKEVAC